ncbi:MAG: hypothetical protein AAF384_17020 [Pseudomonadota bacterium]
MWGENWGTMIWGGGLSIETVPLGPWALVLLGAVIGFCGVFANRRRLARVPLLFALLVPVMSAIALGIPNVFTNGTMADANEVNANFAAISAFFGNPPIVSAVAAQGIPGEVSCSWTASDADGDHLSLSYAAYFNGVRTNESVSVDDDDAAGLVIEAGAPAGQSYFCRVSAYDGKQATAVDSNTVTVPEPST